MLLFLKSMVVFGLLGPPVGLATGLLVVLPLISLMAGAAIETDTVPLALVGLLPPAYMVGLVPAALVGLVDAVLARKSVRGRLAWTTAVGFFVSFLPAAPALLSGYLHGPGILIGGIIGAVPAALCSSLVATGRRVSPGFPDPG